MIIKHGRHIFWEIHEVRKGLWAFSVLIGWACKLRSHADDVVSACYTQSSPKTYSEKAPHHHHHHHAHTHRAALLLLEEVSVGLSSADRCSTIQINSLSFVCFLVRFE